LTAIGEAELLTRVQPAGAVFRLENGYSVSAIDTMAAQDEDQEAAIAWVGLVLMLFSAVSMVALVALAVWWLND
jgi:hypothetical protein